MAKERSGGPDLSREARRAEMLDAETEQRLARAWRDKGDKDALHRLATAHMRLAISMAAKYRRYGVPMNDLVQEAGLGLMKAAGKFDPDRGVRFSTYAMWWIKASVQECVMRDWSIVRTGSTSAQKSLFFNMRRVQAQLEREARTWGREIGEAELAGMIADKMGVPKRDVEAMQGRMAGRDFSLNAKQAGDHEGREWIDALEDDAPKGDEIFERDHDMKVLRGWLGKAMELLNDRERYIVIRRKLRDDPKPLTSLGKELNVSKERVRQLEASALRKMRDFLQDQAPEIEGLAT